MITTDRQGVSWINGIERRRKRREETERGRGIREGRGRGIEREVETTNGMTIAIGDDHD